MSIIDHLRSALIVPVVAIDDAKHAVPLCRALEAGGLNVVEITFRTEAACDAIRAISSELPEFCVGAGTVIRPKEVEQSVAAGAKFAVAPGLNVDIVKQARDAGLPFIPGTCTPTDIETALAAGCKTLKFFPAGAMGGIATLKALAAPYGHHGIQFVPTGGVTAANMSEYLAHPNVHAIGGSWLVAKELIAAENWPEITRLTAEAVAIAQAAVGNSNTKSVRTA
jgi:2-dehydro-3-deoxyphosphogluconate aldolase/(4S)-4-hydroxy-2-oxoglutarate aldolase